MSISVTPLYFSLQKNICDLVTISRLLNATLVIPEIQESIRSKGISSKFKSFSYLYDEEQFIASLKNDVNIVKSLPEYLKAARRRNEFPTFKPKNSASPNFYVKEILPNLRKAKVVGLIITDGGCLQAASSTMKPAKVRQKSASPGMGSTPRSPLLSREANKQVLSAGGSVGELNCPTVESSQAGTISSTSPTDSHSSPESVTQNATLSKKEREKESRNLQKHQISESGKVVKDRKFGGRPKVGGQRNTILTITAGRSISTAISAGTALAVTSAGIDAGGQTIKTDTGKEYYAYTTKKRPADS